MLPLYKKILVATDFSENSNLAFKHAVMLARLNNAEIMLLHVMPPMDAHFRLMVAGHLGKDLIADLEKSKFKDQQEQLKKELDDFAKTELAKFPEDMKRLGKTKVAYGTPDIEILDAATEAGADVIVMGTHGRGIIEHAFIGSVAEKVLRKAKVPVFVIPLKA